MDEQKNKFGLSRKTNITLAAITGITAAADHWPALIAIGVLALYAITLQYRIDKTVQK